MPQYMSRCTWTVGYTCRTGSNNGRLYAPSECFERFDFNYNLIVNTYWVLKVVDMCSAVARGGPTRVCT